MVMELVFDIPVDLKLAKTINKPLVTQNDSVVFILTVTENETPFDLNEATTVSLTHTRYDGTVVVTMGTKLDNKATFVLSAGETSVAGEVTAKAQFYDADGRISTLSFKYQIGADPTGEDYVPSVGEKTLIEIVLNDGPLIIQSAEDAAAYANAQGAYVEAKRPLIDTFTGQQTNLQAQVNQLVVDGDSSPEAAQGRVDAKGNTFTTLKERNDKGQHSVFRYSIGGTVGSETVINVIEGYEGNAVAPTIRGAVISGGGGIGQENIIGGFTTHAVAGDVTPNVVDPTITGAHYAVIGGGYNSVNNALAGVLTGFHCVIEKEATHGTISGGSIHKIIDGDYSTIAGGTLNEINVLDGGGYATISGGMTNKVTGKYGTVSGGLSNEATGERSMVLGGSINKATAYGASVSGGFNNTASGNQSVVTNGQSNVASGSGAAVFGGRNNVANGQDSSIMGGSFNEATAQDSIVRGLYGKAISRGQQVTGAGRFAVTGDAQESKFVLRRQTLDAVVQTLGVDGAGIVPTITAGAAWLFTADVIAKSGADIKVVRVEGVFNKEGTASAAFIGTPTITVIRETAGATTWVVGTLAGSSSLNIRITGQAGKTINWVGKLETVEVIS